MSLEKDIAGKTGLKLKEGSYRLSIIQPSRILVESAKDNSQIGMLDLAPIIERFAKRWSSAVSSKNVQIKRLMVYDDGTEHLGAEVGWLEDYWGEMFDGYKNEPRGAVIRFNSTLEDYAFGSFEDEVKKRTKSDLSLDYKFKK